MRKIGLVITTTVLLSVGPLLHADCSCQWKYENGRGAKITYKGKDGACCIGLTTVTYQTLNADGDVDGTYVTSDFDTNATACCRAA